MVYTVVSPNKQFHFSFNLPREQVPSGKKVYVDLVDSNGNYVGDPIECSYVGSTDIVQAQITAPSSSGKYIILLWIGNWDGSNRTIDEIVWQDTVIVIDKDVYDYLAEINVKVDNALQQTTEILDMLKRVLGLVHENICIDQYEFTDHGYVKKCRIRIYDSAEHVGTDQGVIATYIVESEYVGERLVKFTVKRVA